jgi:hypothetical protein
MELSKFTCTMDEEEEDISVDAILSKTKINGGKIALIP